jgi:small-conductance mechanosensitive channel
MVIVGATLTGILGAWLMRRVAAWVAGPRLRRSRLFTWAIGIAIGLAVASRFQTIIGSPVELRRYMFPFFGAVLALAGSVVLWHLLQVAAIVLQRIAARTATATDDILFTLLLAAARLGVIAIALLGIAHFLSIPTSGILAGFGIGGLAFAFASRETLSNVFGAGILVSDRPFRRGDWITSGDIDGSVEHVGIRSTRVRTAHDSIMVVPNGRLADSVINNLGTRRHRLLNTQLLVTSGATPEKLDAFTQAVRQRVASDKAFVASRTEVGISGIAASGIQVELTTYLDVPTTSAERAAKHALFLDVVQLAEKCGVTLGLGMLTVPSKRAGGRAGCLTAAAGGLLGRAAPPRRSEPTDLHRLQPVDADALAAGGERVEPLDHAPEDVARRPAERPEDPPAITVEHPDLPQLVAQPLHHSLGLVEPQAVAGDRKAGLVLDRDGARVEGLGLRRQAQHDLRPGEHGMHGGDPHRRGERPPDRSAGLRRAILIELDDAAHAGFDELEIETSAGHDRSVQSCRCGVEGPQAPLR